MSITIVDRCVSLGITALVHAGFALALLSAVENDPRDRLGPAQVVKAVSARLVSSLPSRSPQAPGGATKAFHHVDVDAILQSLKELSSKPERSETERAEAREAARARRLAARRQSLREQLEAEVTRSVSRDDTALRDAYASFIQQAAILSWRRPPGSVDGLAAEVEIQLVPSGKIIAAKLVRSSGNQVYDRSVMQAARSIPQLREFEALDVGLFDEYFRFVTLVFRPEDT